MNLVFGQRERKEIGARTKRAMEEMAIQKIHPAKAHYGYIRNNESFNFTEYREIKINEIGTASYTMSPKQWIQRTNEN